MTGPEHYRAAENLLAHECDVDCYAGHQVLTFQHAQLHATLALTAATALAGITLTLPDGSDLAADWNTAILADWRVAP